MATPDPRRHAPATARNAAPILAVLHDILPPAGLVLEVASGSGEHVIRFAAALPTLDWQPSDSSADARASIAAWTAEAAPANIRPPLALDAARADWPIDRADAVLCINMVHISPWAATVGLMRGAARVLAAGAPLLLYGPYRVAGQPTAPSNEAFDESLRRTDPAWGLRDLDTVTACAAEHGLSREAVIAMPANNLSLVFRRL
ncbi:DUF938 domain-containing protein [Sphingomonas profundi]|uniref:DUF938 domain-containing protein n=1 Tax=Alterirhizorhabdus profundi TaxID=2681549 RepID=UPI0012E79009|nr:DUF938 domain-containing protein [Sphingomonas profundi]